jgi:hypothetical protein
MTMKRAIIILITLIAGAPAWADAITLDGVRHEGVHIRTTDRMVFVHFPEDGRVEALMHREVADDAIEFGEDAADREAAWRLAREAQRAAAAAAEAARALPRPRAQFSLPQLMQPVAPAPTLRAAPRTDPPERAERLTELPVTDGIVPRVDLRDVPLGTALKAMLRPMGLDYEVREGMIYISDPETIRVESWEPLETRVYDIKNFDATLPKIIVMNPGGQRFLERGGVPQGGFGPAFQGQRGAGIP